MTQIDTNPQKINDLLSRGVHEIFTQAELKEKLMSGKQLHLKLGIDVTGPQIHLGHTVIQRKIRDFQELGHKVTLIIGDFTTLIGDHSDKVDMRSARTPDQIKKDEQTYTEQFFKTVLQNQTEIRHNSEWLKDLNFNDVIRLAKQFTIAQMLERETFLIRYKQQKPIGLDEFLYPLMQGYDSVELKCDVEFGGTDQTFNLLAGRHLMSAFNLPPQSCVVMKLLVGSDGRPMGKSLQNYIAVTENPIDMYGKVMSIVDEVIFDYFELVTRIPMAEIEQMKSEIAAGANPMQFKKKLAFEIVTFYHSEDDAVKAAHVFEETVQNKEISQEFITKTSTTGDLSLLEFLRKNSPETISSGDIKRTITQGGVEVNGVKETDFNKQFAFKAGDMIKFGKRVFIEIE
jgi:tyrosyl-tRNA synthetase